MNEQPANRGPNGKFIPGNNANPSGRPKTATLAALCREAAPEVVARLLAIAKGKSIAAVKAAELVLAYGFGKPALNITANVTTAFDDSRFRGAARAALEAAIDAEAPALEITPMGETEAP